MPSSEVLAKFAESHQLSFAEHMALPREGDALDRDTGQVEGSATGKLPGGIDGTLAHYTYSYTVTDADDHTHTVHRRQTVVVTRVPESIGFVPTLGFAGSGSQLSATGSSLAEVRSLDLGDDQALKDARAYVYKGSSENWVTQLLSPALLDWLARSADDFGFELSNGVLCAARNEYLTDAADLETLCNDAAHVAGAIREESLEETATGGAAAEAAKAPDQEAPKMEEALAKVAVGSPANVAVATPAFAGHLRSLPTFFWALGKAVLIALVLNVPGAAIPILLIVAGNYAVLAAIEAVLIAILLFFIFRKKVREGSKRYAAEAFFRAYAKDRELSLEEPLKFAATHAEAKLPFKPDRVLSGPLPGGSSGSLVLVGDGSKREDRIAVVAGPKGPVAETELQAEAPGISAKLLDGYAERLSKEVAEDLATQPG